MSPISLFFNQKPIEVRSNTDYIVDFENLKSVSRQELTFHLTDDFFALSDEFSIKNGDVDVKVLLEKISFGHFLLSFEIEGELIVPCDRCLDDVEVYVETEETFKVRYVMDVQIGNEIFSSSEQDDEFDFTLPDGETKLDLTWTMYELIELAIPLQHIHSDGECNLEMEQILLEHLAVLPGEEDGDAECSDTDTQSTDPRWDALKKISNNN